MPKASIHIVLVAVLTAAATHAMAINRGKVFDITINENGKAVKSKPGETIIDTDNFDNFVKREEEACFSVDTGYPSNMHWNDLNQYVVTDTKNCRPALELQNGTCHHHMDLGNRCSSFCQVSAFYYYSEPIDLMAGKMCRFGEGCELKTEESYRVEVANTEVERHVRDTTLSLSPTTSWGLGFKQVDVGSIPTKRDLSNEQEFRDFMRAIATDDTVAEHDIIGRVLAEMERQELEQEFQEEVEDRLQKLRKSNPADLLTLAEKVPFSLRDQPLAEHTSLVGPGAYNPQLSTEMARELDRVKIDLQSRWRQHLHNVANSIRSILGRRLKGPLDYSDPNTGRRTIRSAQQEERARKAAKLFNFKLSKSSGGNVVPSSTEAAQPHSAASSPAQPPGRKISIPVPQVLNPQMSIAGSFSAHWTRDWTKTYHHQVERAMFRSMTHKQVPGEGCGAFWAVPVSIAYCGWLALPRFPPTIQEKAIDWLRTTSNTYSGTLKLGSWPDINSRTADAKPENPYPSQQWNITAGRCPVNYHEMPYCQASPLMVPDRNGGEPQALQRTVWRPYDCESGEILPSHMQPREVREQIDFDEFFKLHALKDPRLYNPHLSWYPLADAKHLG